MPASVWRVRHERTSARLRRRASVYRYAAVSNGVWRVCRPSARALGQRHTDGRALRSPVFRLGGIRRPGGPGSTANCAHRRGCAATMAGFALSTPSGRDQSCFDRPSSRNRKRGSARPLGRWPGAPAIAASSRWQRTLGTRYWSGMARTRPGQRPGGKPPAAGSCALLGVGLWSQRTIVTGGTKLGAGASPLPLGVVGRRSAARLHRGAGHDGSRFPAPFGGLSKVQGSTSSALAKRSMLDRATFQRERSTDDT